MDRPKWRRKRLFSTLGAHPQRCATSETRKLSLAMPLTFGADAGVTVTNLDTLARGTYTLVEVTGENNSLTVADGFHLRSDFGGSKKWRVRAVGNKIELYPGPGIIVLVR